jgi:hypothetical protein
VSGVLRVGTTTTEGGCHDRIELAAATGLATAAIGIGALVAAPAESAKPMSCETALALADHYTALAYIALNVFNSPADAGYWAGRARGVMEAAC